MTDEELDLLASSFLDGEATPDEVAMIERDPNLAARVEELRVAQAAVRAPVPAPSMRLKEEQLTAALAAFDADDRRSPVIAVDGPPSGSPEDAAAEPPDTGPVINLESRRREREEREATAAGRMRWLSAVAGVFVFTAGAVFLIGQVNGGGDDSEFATDAMSEETDTADEAELAPADDGAAAGSSANADMGTDDAADDGTDGEVTSEALGPADAEEDFALEESEEAADEGDTADEAASTADADNGPTIRDDLPEEGFFGDEPVVTYTTVPTSDELLAQLDLPWRNPDSANCAIGADLPDGAEVIAYLPIEIPADESGAGGPATQVVEALYLTVGNESLVILVDPDTCEAV